MRLKLFLLAVLCMSAAVSAYNQSALVTFLQGKQLPDGSFGAWSPYTSFAVLGLAGVEGNSSSVYSAQRFLEAELAKNDSFMWSEADEVGAALYAMENYSFENRPAIEQRLSTMQQLSGGFKGWWTESGTVEDSVNTAFALLGHASLNASQKNAATTYLLALQNADGSFNHSASISSTSLSTLGPDKTSTTALALFALSKVGFTASNASISSALTFLKTSAETCFEGSYSSALAALAFTQFDETAYAGAASSHLKTLQNASTGGYSDIHRFSTQANAIDSGIALRALSLNLTTNATCSPANSTPSLSLTASPSVALNGSAVLISLNASKPLENVTLTLTYPNASTAALTFSNNSMNSFQTTFTGTATLGNYSVTVMGVYLNNSYPATSSFLSSPPVKVLVAASLANATTVLNCVTVASQSRAELAVRQAFPTEWAMFSYGNLLAKLLDVGCPASNPFCQSSCNLYWNFFTYENSTWTLANVGLSDYAVENGSVIGLAWSNNFSQTPPTVSFSTACYGNVSTVPSQAGLSTCPSPATPTPAPQQTITLSIDFPQSSGKQDATRTMSLSSCSKALDCFNSIAQVTCQYSPALGGLSCPGVTQTCYITAVDGVNADFNANSAWWGFYVNNALASEGVSCYTPKAGERLELKYNGNDITATPTPPPSSSRFTPTITPTPQAIVPASTPTPAPSAQNDSNAFSIAFAPSTPYSGPLQLIIPVSFDDYQAGRIDIKPKPDRVEKGSVKAYWDNATASKEKPFNVTVTSAAAVLPKGIGSLSTLTPPSNKTTQNQEQIENNQTANPTTTPTIQPSIKPVTGLATAQDNTTPMIILATITAMLGAAVFLKKKAA